MEQKLDDIFDSILLQEMKYFVINLMSVDLMVIVRVIEVIGPREKNRRSERESRSSLCFVFIAALKLMTGQKMRKGSLSATEKVLWVSGENAEKSSLEVKLTRREISKVGL